MIKFKNGAFPSPYGVSFILMVRLGHLNRYILFDGFRLLTEYHSFLYTVELPIKVVSVENTFPSPYGVSFILMLEMYLHY